jgi:hypothetical protein
VDARWTSETPLGVSAENGKAPTVSVLFLLKHRVEDVTAALDYNGELVRARRERSARRRVPEFD